MKAIIFTRDGFRKDVVVSKEAPYLRLLKNNRTSLVELDKRDWFEEVPIIQYELIRSFLNEYDEKVLIYREM